MDIAVLALYRVAPTANDKPPLFPARGTMIVSQNVDIPHRTTRSTSC